MSQTTLPPPRETSAPPGARGGPHKRLEPRNFGRAAVCVEVTLQCEDRSFVGLSEDISETGLFVVTDTLLAVGSWVALELHLPGSARPLAALGSVVRVRPSDRSAGIPAGIAIELADLGEADIAEIRELVEAREPLFWA